jgi:hypothetical protein
MDTGRWKVVVGRQGGPNARVLTQLKHPQVPIFYSDIRHLRNRKAVANLLSCLTRNGPHHHVKVKIFEAVDMPFGDQVIEP